MSNDNAQKSFLDDYSPEQTIENCKDVLSLLSDLAVVPDILSEDTRTAQINLLGEIRSAIGALSERYTFTEKEAGGAS